MFALRPVEKSLQRICNPLANDPQRIANPPERPAVNVYRRIANPPEHQLEHVGRRAKVNETTFRIKKICNLGRFR
jgi:hypothetical protein